MTQLPSDPTPGIPGAADWQGSRPQPPAFTSPRPLPPAASTGDTQQFRLASWGARFGATIIDQLLRLTIAAVVTLIAWTLLADDPFSWAGDTAFDTFSEADSGGYNADEFNVAWLVISGIAVYFLLGLIYAPITMRMWRGATPGKRATGIRVVRADGRDLSFGDAFVREPIIKGFLIGWIGGIVFFVPVLNYLWPLWDSECRAGHDYMARTRVVKAPGR